MNGTIRWTATIGTLLTAATLALVGPLRAQEKPVLTATPSSPNSVDLGWTAPPGATQYRVQRGPAGGGPWSQLTRAISQLAYTDATAQPATTYAYRVQARWPDDSTVASDPVSVTTPAAGARMPAAAVGPALQGVRPLPARRTPQPPTAAALPQPVLPNLTCSIERLAGGGGQMGSLSSSTAFLVKSTGEAGVRQVRVSGSLALNGTLVSPDFPALGPTWSYVHIPGSFPGGGAGTAEWAAYYYGIASSFEGQEKRHVMATMVVDPLNEIAETNEMDNTCQYDEGGG